MVVFWSSEALEAVAVSAWLVEGVEGLSRLAVSRTGGGEDDWWGFRVWGCCRRRLGVRGLVEGRVSEVASARARRKEIV